MQLRCPKCQKTFLDETRGGAVALCATCGGTWVRMYEVTRPIETATDGAPSAGETDSKTGLCPAGHGLMTRARVDAASPFALERCSSCLGVWFDRGEWQRVAEAHLLEELPQFWTREWQEQQRKRRSREAHLEASREDFGDELYVRLTELAAALREHPRRSEALAFLAAESDARSR